MADDEKQPKTVLYPRDPSLDPQLVWKGKDEQDARDLEVPAVPIYIQEQIKPQAIIENVRAEAQHGVPAQSRCSPTSTDCRSKTASISITTNRIGRTA